MIYSTKKTISENLRVNLQAGEANVVQSDSDLGTSNYSGANVRITEWSKTTAETIKNDETEEDSQKTYTRAESGRWSDIRRS